MQMLYVNIFVILLRIGSLNDNQKFKANKCTIINKAVSGVTFSATAGIKFTFYNYLMLNTLLQGLSEFLLILFIYSLIL
jgi:hypothetical protein